MCAGQINGRSLENLNEEKQEVKTMKSIMIITLMIIFSFPILTSLKTKLHGLQLIATPSQACWPKKSDLSQDSCKIIVLKVIFFSHFKVSRHFDSLVDDSDSPECGETASPPRGRPETACQDAQ